MPSSTQVEKETETHSSSTPHPQKRMVRFRPSEALGTRFPAMHLVRSSWFCRVIARTTALLMVVFLLAAIYVPWQQTSRCEGVVTARNPNERRQVFLSTAKGIIAEQKLGLQEGSHVEKGETIMVLDTLAKDQIELIQSQQKQLEDKKSFTQSQLEFAMTQVENTEESGRQLIRAAQAEIDAAHAKWESAEAEVEAQLARLAQAEFDVQAFEPLAGKTVSQQKFQQAINNEIVEAKKLTRAERAKDEAAGVLEAKRRDLDSKRQEIDKKISEAKQKVDEYRNKLADIQKESQDISVKLGELERLRIVSPTSGRVQSILGQVGKAVDVKDMLFELIPDTDDLWVELSVRGLDQPLIKTGDKVRIQFEGWPAIQFVGWPSVARGTFGGVVIAINPADDGTGNFKIFVGPDPDDPAKEKWPDRRYLRQGVRANAWVILDSVPLGFEIWRQLNGFPPTRSGVGPDGGKAKDAKAPKLK